MHPVLIPPDLHAVLDDAWNAARRVPGFLLEHEARFIGMAAACGPQGEGRIVEIGSFKGKSTIVLARVARHYGLGRVVAIDPHNFHSPELSGHRTKPGASSYDEFAANLRAAGVEEMVEVHRAYSGDVARTWTEPIRFLWIDGDHGYAGAKADFDGFVPHLEPHGVVAMHDALHEFSGPIRVFVEDVLRSDQFGAAGFVHSIAWAQLRPEDGAALRGQRAALERRAGKLIPYVRDGKPLRGMRKMVYKLRRARVPRAPMEPEAWAALVNRAG